MKTRRGPILDSASLAAREEMMVAIRVRDDLLEIRPIGLDDVDDVLAVYR